MTAPMPQRLPWRDELVQTVLGLWAVAGLFVDGWAHNHGKPESFFTPWHGLLYSGATAGIVYGSWAQRRAARRGEAHVGQRLTLLGILLFVAGAVGDMGWHLVFGVEVDIEALLSPTHLLLMTGGILALTGPFRSAWGTPGPVAPTFRDFLPPLLSLTLGVAVASFFWMYLSPFVIGVYVVDAPVGARDGADLVYMRGIAAVMLSTVLLVAPVLLVLRRWRPPFGAFALLLGLVALLTSGLEEFRQWPTVGAAVAGGLAGDVLVRAGAGARAVGWVVPAVLWLAFFALFDAAEGVGWSVELWGGTVVMASLAGLGLSLLVAPPAIAAVPAAPSDTAAPVGARLS